MADASPNKSEGAVTSPKKKNKSSPKKQKHNSTKKFFQKTNNSKDPVEYDDKEHFTKGETSNVSQALPKEDDRPDLQGKKKFAQHPQFQQKKKYNSPSKKNNTLKTQNNTPQALEAGSYKTENCKLDKAKSEENKKQLDYQRKQIEEERRKRWHRYFLSKPHEFITLDRNKIVLLNYMDRARPQAQFLCRVCKYYCDGMSVVATHIRKIVHQKQLKDYNDEVTLSEMPELTQDQMAVLDDYLSNVVAVHSLNLMDLDTRSYISMLVKDLITKNLKGCSIRLFGSSFHGLGLNNSDVNIDLQVPEGSLPPAILKEVATLLQTSPHFMNVREKFECEFPYISFTHTQSSEECCISLNNERAVNLAILLSKYTPLDPRLLQLAVLFRLWGQLSKIDKQQDGTLPGYAFYLLTIFYLQQTADPVLPVLNDLLTEKDESEISNTMKVLSMPVEEIREKWSTNNKQNLAALWIGLIRFYTVDFNYNEYIVSIDSSALISRKTRKLFIVDPFLPTRNVARSVVSNDMFYYIVECLITTCYYFSVPQSNFGPIFGSIYVPAAKYHASHEALIFTHNCINSKLIQIIMKIDTNFAQHRQGVQESIAEVMQLMHLNDFRNIDNIPVEVLEQTRTPPRHLYRDMSVSVSDAQLMISSFSASALEYNFTTATFTGGLELPKICSICRHEGHLNDKCPEEELPPLEILPLRTPEALQILNDLCFHIFEKCKQSDEDIAAREMICQELQEFICAAHPTTKLQLFGSTKNGFGLKGSDMDICLTFDDKKAGEGVDTRAFIEILHKLLKTFKDVQDLLPIATAKVPIIKFTHKATKLEGDISLYNVLGMENTKLLNTYSKIDIRAQILGYMMKRFSKICHIGDASKGSLSSYAYTLIVIYFLQRCEPPVLPVLQELTEPGNPLPKHIVEGCNAYFFQDITKLDKVWAGKGQNKLSVGELWLNLLVYYTEQFDLLSNVISIRCSRTITKFEKLWISKGIAIEDPFDLSHNLGSALTRKMSLYIVKALRKGRNHFGSSINLNASVNDIESYYLNPMVLTDGEPPNDRGCRFCKSIGHKERDCPEKKKRRIKKQYKNKESSPKNKTPIETVQIKNSGDNDASDSNSDKGISDQDEEQPREMLKNLEIGSLNKLETVAHYKQVSVSESHSNSPNRSSIIDQTSLEKDWQNQCFQQVPLDCGLQDKNRVYGPQFGPFRVNSPSKKQINVPLTLKIQNTATNASIQPMMKMPIPDATFIAQTPKSNCNQTPIPSIVFNNSKLATEIAYTPVRPIRYPFPPSQEPSRPPPGFIPLASNMQRFSNAIPFMQEQKLGGQNSWKYDGMPLFTTPMTNSSVEFIHSGPMYTSPSPASSLASSGASPRPSIGPAFSNLRFTGMLAPTEQLIWGQSPLQHSQVSSLGPNTTEKTFATNSTTLHTYNTSIAKLQANAPANADISLMEIAQKELKTIQQECPTKNNERDSSRNKTIQQSGSAKSKNFIKNFT